ncbi:hypothetical protein FHS42_005855 [Streptomyces zagrosensis]|uniref:Uncharacterized protein n=1 Tax=Streptomyces zagrosensis TaxID=1042984 RepID=A0A7W9QF06_9ACTN|nr:hypothetical protein [Streptomyces zagrosensis]
MSRPMTAHAPGGKHGHDHAPATFQVARRSTTAARRRASVPYWAAVPGHGLGELILAVSGYIAAPGPEQTSFPATGPRPRGAPPAAVTRRGRGGLGAKAEGNKAPGRSPVPPLAHGRRCPGKRYAREPERRTPARHGRPTRTEVSARAVRKHTSHRRAVGLRCTRRLALVCRGRWRPPATRSALPSMPRTRRPGSGSRNAQGRRRTRRLDIEEEAGVMGGDGYGKRD